MQPRELREKRVLALDPGSHRLGIAIWSPEAELARPMTHISRKSISEDLKKIEKLVTDQKVEAFLVGLAYALSGNETESTRLGLFWAETLKNHFDIPVIQFDESFSSKQALDILKGKSPKKKKELKDSLSAAIFLEEYMNAGS